MARAKAYTRKQENEKYSETKLNSFYLKEYHYISIIFFVVLIVYLPVFSADFVSWDDYGYLFSNENIYRDFSFTELFSSFAVMGNYHPLTLIVYKILYLFFGFNPMVFHAVNVFLHAINSFLVFRLSMYIVKSKDTALIAALLFAIHPLHVESVAWVSELKDVLYSLFFLLAVLAYMKYQSGNKKQFVWVNVFFILSCLSKGMAVVLPLVLLSFDLFRNKKITSKDITTKLLMFVISFLFGILAVYAQSESGATPDLSDYSVWQRLLFPFYAYVFYILKMFLPVELSIIYPYPDAENIPIFYYIAPFLVFGLIFIVFKIKKYYLLKFAVIFYTITIFFVLQIKPVGNYIAADRYFYLSSVGFFILIPAVLFEKIGKKYFYIIFIPIIILLSLASHNRTKIWTNSLTLWQSVLKVYPQNPTALYNIAHYYQDKNQEKALVFYKKSLKNDADNEKTLNNIGNIYYYKQNFDSAFVYYTKALEANPTFDKALYNMGNIYFVRKDFNTALEYYKRCININPSYYDAYVQVGVCLINTGDTNKALPYLQKAKQAGNRKANEILLKIQ